MSEAEWIPEQTSGLGTLSRLRHADTQTDAQGEEDEDIYTMRSHTSVRRYDRYVPTFATDRRVVRVTHH